MSSNWHMMASYGVATGLVTAATLWWSPAWLRQPKQELRMWCRTHKSSVKGMMTALVSLVVFGLPYITVAIIWLVLSMPLLSHRIGEQVAVRNLARQAPTCEIAAADPGRYFQCVTARKGSEAVRGYLIAATSTYFVIALDGRTRAIPSDGWEFESTYKSGTQAAAFSQ